MRRLLKLTGFAIALFAIGLAIVYVKNPIALFIYYRCVTGAESPIDCVNRRPTHFRTNLFGMTYEGDTEDMIDRHVLVLGAYEKPELFFLRDVSRGGVFLDIGANKGTYSLFMSKYAKEIHAFEPYEPVLQHFRHMIAINGINNIFIHPVGLGDKSARLPFERPRKDNEGVGSFAFVSTAGQHDELQIATGDEALKAAGVKKVELIKMDIEGFERPALIGLKETLQRDRPIIVFELTARRDNSVLFKSEKDLQDGFPANYKFLQLENREPFTGAYSLGPLSVNFDSELEQHDIVAFPLNKKARSRFVDLSAGERRLTTTCTYFRGWIRIANTNELPRTEQSDSCVTSAFGVDRALATVEELLKICRQTGAEVSRPLVGGEHFLLGISALVWCVAEVFLNFASSAFNWAQPPLRAEWIT